MIRIFFISLSTGSISNAVVYIKLTTTGKYSAESGEGTFSIDITPSAFLADGKRR